MKQINNNDSCCGKCGCGRSREMADEATTTLFVYGTLKSGHSNNYLLNSSKFLGRAKTVEKYAMSAGGIPFVYKEPALYPIFGELYEVKARELQSIDALEGNGYFYTREEITAVLINDNINDNINSPNQFNSKDNFLLHRNYRTPNDIGGPADLIYNEGYYDFTNNYDDNYTYRDFFGNVEPVVIPAYLYFIPVGIIDKINVMNGFRGINFLKHGDWPSNTKE